MNPVCRLCQESIPRRAYSAAWDKRLFGAQMRYFPMTVYEASVTLYGYEGPSDGHICRECFNKVNKHYQTYTTLDPEVKQETSSPQKRPATEETPSAAKRKKTVEEDEEWIPDGCGSPRVEANRVPTTDRKKQRKRTRTSRLITKAINNSRYYTALRHILSHGEVAEKAFLKVLSKKIKKEMETYVKGDSFPVIDGTSSIENFSWPDVFGQMRGQMPILTTAVEAAMPCVDQEKHRSLVLPRMGFMLSIILYTINPKKFSFLQALHGLQMWRCGSRETLVKYFNHLGICQSAGTIRKHVDNFREGPDNNMNQLKEALEHHIDETLVGPYEPATEQTDSDNATPESSTSIVPTVDYNGLYDNQWEDVSDSDDGSDEENLPLLVETQSSQGTLVKTEPTW